MSENIIRKLNDYIPYFYTLRKEKRVRNRWIGLTVQRFIWRIKRLMFTRGPKDDIKVR